MITVVSDTHGSDDHRLDGRTLEAVREADLVIHAGDFTTEAVLDAFLAEACATSASENGAAGANAGDATGASAGESGAGEFVAVAGNNDDDRVRDRLAATRVVERAGVRFAVVHGHEHDETGASLLGRQEGADVVVVGHSHRPGFEAAGAVAVLNPGSHADPRWYRPAHAELEPTTEGLCGRLVTPGGEVLSEFDLAVSGRE